MMRDATAAVISRHDYAPSAFFIDQIDLTFDLDPVRTRVLSRMQLRRNAAVSPSSTLRLDGEDLSLARVLVNGVAAIFTKTASALLLEQLPPDQTQFELEIFTTCAPENNTQLMGLYVSQGHFFTQCEAEGFRRISYFLDRPDIMAKWRVTLRANAQRFPVLLSNGNRIDAGTLPEGRAFAVWDDPHPKPSYLFALVAANLVCREQTIISRSGKRHLLQIYVRAHDLDKTEHAMQSLQASIAWDEARFNLALDLDRFMVVAVSDFNMGAMENKGLNIFNTKFILANPATATDVDYANVQSVIAHEYFHNWTGNRVTCRDWFQLSLKEGLTVFRDQEFSQDMSGSDSARALKRIEDVRVLRSVQFAEDAGPMAHPVRPDQYVQINNFYTSTVYDKGAEVVRMMQTLVGRAGFAKGMALYFARHDGQAVTCDDFLAAMADANPRSQLDLHRRNFARWYAQAGTPRLRVQAQALPSAAGGRPGLGLRLHLSQHCPATSGQEAKLPFVIPIRLGLIASDGSAIAVAHADLQDDCLVLTQQQATLDLPDVPSNALPSVLRGFSAPVILEMDVSDDDLRLQLAHDCDAFNCWEAAQRLLVRQLLQAIHTPPSLAADAPASAPVLDAATLAALQQVLRNSDLDAGLRDAMLTLPGESYLADQCASVDPSKIHSVALRARQQLAQALHDDWRTLVDAARAQRSQGYSPDAIAAGRRALANRALLYATLAGDAVFAGKAWQQVKDARNMTDRFGALQALVISRSSLAERALDYFYQRHAHEDLVVDKWFALQAAHGQTAATAEQLSHHPAFTLSNPNRARSLTFALCMHNPAALHQPDGSGYAFWQKYVLALDAHNPQVAARLARALESWQKLQAPYRQHAKQALQAVAAHSGLSRDSSEVVQRILQTP